MIHLVIGGPPGSGKGTQAKMIANKYGFLHISTGAVLRDAIEKGTRLGKLAKQKIDHGNFVSDDVAQRIIEEYLEENKLAKGVIFDGYPRTIIQAKIYEEMLQKMDVNFAGFLLLQVEDFISKDRLLARAKKSNRADDADLGIISHRIEIYHERTEPLINFFLDLNKLHKINGDGGVEEVFVEVCQIVDQILKHE